jgi:Heterokaryon incompatibility protein (HET)
LRAPKQGRSSASEGNTLCEDCRQIDFRKVFDADISSLQKDYNGILLADLGPRCIDLSTTTGCQLCSLLRESRRNFQDQGYELRIYSYLTEVKRHLPGRLTEEHQTRDVPCLRLGSAGLGNDYIFCLGNYVHGEFLFTPRILGQNADLALVKEWLHYCDANHEQCRNCEIQVSGLRLMDCETYDVISAPLDAAYVALSYVWGAVATFPEDPSMESPKAPDFDLRIPKTVRDAAAATKLLGYQYLWIDKLCIYVFRRQDSCHRFWRHLPPETAVIIATFCCAEDLFITVQQRSRIGK